MLTHFLYHWFDPQKANSKAENFYLLATSILLKNHMHKYTGVQYIFSNSHLLYCCSCWSEYKTLCQELDRAWPQFQQFPTLKGTSTHLRERPLKIMICVTW